MKLYSIFLLTLLFSCNIKSKSQQELTVGNNAISNPTQKQYSFFNDQLLITSDVKPYEEDGKKSVSDFTLPLYTDIKKYSFPNLIPQGLMSITVAEFKDRDSALSAKEQLNEIIKMNENQDVFKIHFDSPKLAQREPFLGYWSKGRTFVNGKESTFMYVGVLTDQKILITVLTVYDDPGNLDIINKMISSIKRNLK